MSKLPGYDETVVCPYNKCHVILKHRIQTHLVKCARSHPQIKLETCPFDVTHRFAAEEKSKHLAECPSRDNFDRYMYTVRNEGNAPAEQRPRPPPPKIDSDEEDWDHYDTPTYDANRYAVNAKVLRAPVLLAPAERRKFADAERKRLSQFDRRQ